MHQVRESKYAVCHNVGKKTSAKIVMSLRLHRGGVDYSVGMV